MLAISPFSLLFFVPLLFWLLISPLREATAKRQSLSRASRSAATRERNPQTRTFLNIVLFLLGGLVFYGLFYFFGFVIYDYKFAFGWFMLMMLSIQMTSFWTAAVITAVVGTGLSLVVEPE